MGRRTGRARCLIAGAGVWVAVATVSSYANAEPTAAEKETARALMAEGRDLRDRNDLATALQRFRGADAIMHVPTTGLELARTQAALGQLVEARETLNRVSHIPEQPSDPAPFQEARAEAEKLDEQLERRISSIRFEVRKPADAAAPAILIDGVPIAASILDVPFRSNPGHHVVEGRLGETVITQSVYAHDAETVTVALDFSQIQSTTAPHSAPDASRVAGTPAPWPVLATVGFSVGAVGVAVGAVTGVLAISAKKSAEGSCVAGECPPTAWPDIDRMSTFASVSTISFVVGGLGAAAGVTSLVLVRTGASTTATPSSVRLSAAPRGFMVSGSF